MTLIKASIPLFSLMVAIGCTKRNPAACCTTAADCDVKGLPEGTTCDDGLTCVNNECTPATACEADSDCSPPVARCDTERSFCVACLSNADCEDEVCDQASRTCAPCSADEQCETGYCSASTNLCESGILTPKYVPGACDGSGVAPLVVSMDAVIDTSDDTWCHGGIIPQTSAPEICILRYTTIDVTATLTLVGTRVVALVADGDISIEGTLDASGANVRGLSGAGGGTSISGGGRSSTVGGGGAGFRTAGGHGGGTTNGGAATVISSTVLVGGPRSPGLSGGAGGGALTLISCRGRVSTSGAVLAGGEGGSQGPQILGPSEGGGGGGAGGQVVFQARSLNLGGLIAANGGGGGGGAGCTSGGPDGQDGNFSVCMGIPDIGNKGGGGAGGCQQNVPGAGGVPFTPGLCPDGVSTPTPGGGGGSMGYIRTAMPAGRTPTVTSTTISPAFELNETLETH